jgi:hypothetical protein
MVYHFDDVRIFVNISSFNSFRWVYIVLMSLLHEALSIAIDVIRVFVNILSCKFNSLGGSTCCIVNI